MRYVHRLTYTHSLLLLPSLILFLSLSRLTHIHTQTAIVLKGVVRAERLPDPTEFIPSILENIKKEYIVKTYGIKDWEVGK